MNEEQKKRVAALCGLVDAECASLLKGVTFDQYGEPQGLEKAAADLKAAGPNLFLPPPKSATEMTAVEYENFKYDMIKNGAKAFSQPADRNPVEAMSQREYEAARDKICE